MSLRRHPVELTIPPIAGRPSGSEALNTAGTAVWPHPLRLLHRLRAPIVDPIFPGVTTSFFAAMRELRRDRSAVCTHRAPSAIKPVEASRAE